LVEQIEHAMVKMGFKARRQRKDMRILLESAQELDLSLATATATMVAQWLNVLDGAGLGEADSAELFEVIRGAVVTDQTPPV
jgi:3-hydroxyisobutyrate dehydrogenase-like beta-hydroxyacid dehydrogenase